jgi:hypothetical protein
MPGLLHDPKKDDVQMILSKIKGVPSSENSSDAIKAENEQNVEMITSVEDPVDASVAEEAAAQSLMTALSAQDPKGIISAIKDVIELMNLDKDDDLKKLLGK